MTLQEFHNNLRIMRSIDGYELQGIRGATVERFLQSPFETFIRMSDDERETVWSVIRQRQPKRQKAGDVESAVAEAVSALRRVSSELRTGPDGEGQDLCDTLNACADDLADAIGRAN